VTDSPSDPPAEEPVADEGEAAASPAAEFAAEIAELVGAARWSADHETVRVVVDRDRWVDAITAAAGRGGLPFFSWLSAADWSKEVAVGEEVQDVDSLEERFEVICRLSSVRDARSAHFIAAVPKDDPVIASLVSTFGGAAWHEREAAEMFGIRFAGHPHLVNLYLPDAFEGHPLRKSYALLAREVKPWPGTVDVEDMPSVENVEAAAMEGGDA
jgi:NADH-quinone oxidoreductase subunit C